VAIRFLPDQLQVPAKLRNHASLYEVTIVAVKHVSGIDPFEFLGGVISSAKPVARTGGNRDRGNAQARTGVAPACLCESFPTSRRAAGVGFGFSSGALVGCVI
jgi:hypothetical protein